MALSAAIAVTQGVSAQGIEEVTVTGTRIRQTDGMVTPVPVTTVSTAELRDFEPGGTIAEQLDVLPQFFRSETSQRGGGNMITGAGGAGYLNMRSLGRQRTLVLVDGQRIVPADKFGAVNVEVLPMALMRSVDVVTGGASAQYGADALGGVTNFVIDRQFEGLKFEAGTGVTDFGDGRRWEFSVAGGERIGERLNLIGSLEARHIDEIWRNPEDLPADWHQGWGHVVNPDWLAGVPGAPQRLTRPWVASSRSNPTGIIRARNGSADHDPLIPFRYNEMTFLEDGSDVRPFNRGDYYDDPLRPAAPGRPGSFFTLSGGPEAQIYNRAVDFGPRGNEVDAHSAFGGLRYQFTDRLSGFAQMIYGVSKSGFTRRRGDYYLAGGQHANIFRDNAFLPEHIALAMDEAGIESFQLHKSGAFVGDLEPGVGARVQSDFETLSYSFGVDWDIGDKWSLRASWQTGHSTKDTSINDMIRVDRLFLAMDAVRHPETGAIVCRVQVYDPTPEELASTPALNGRLTWSGDPLPSPIGLDNTVRDCVPFNVMGSGNMNRAAYDYVMQPLWAEASVRQDFAEVLVNGELHKAWGYGPVSLATGFTWREQSFRDGAYPKDVDALGPPINAPELGIQGISSQWTDTLATLWQFTLLPTIAGEMDVWEVFGELNAPMWAATSGNRRLDASLAYRHSEYSRTGGIGAWKLGLDFQVLPGLRLRGTRSRDVREASLLERFNEGASGAIVQDPVFGGTAFQTAVVVRGNPDLRPEIGHTTVAGFVLQPRLLDGFSFSADWYEVNVKDWIGQLGAQRYLDECANFGLFCDYIQRGPDNTIGRITDPYVNVSQAKVEGIDFEIHYRAQPNFLAARDESLSLRLLGGKVLERSTTTASGAKLDEAGALSTPDFTAIATVDYRVGPYGVMLQQRYIGPTILNIRWQEGVHVDDNTVASGTFTNLRLTYDGESVNGRTWNVALNVTNLFDRAPPRVANNAYWGGAPTTDTFFDVFGRRYMLSFGMDF